MTERQIARFELAHVTQHFGFGVVRVENRMGEELRFAVRELRNADWRFSDDVIREDRARCAPRKIEISSSTSLCRRRFIERNADGARAETREDCIPLVAACSKIIARSIPRSTRIVSKKSSCADFEAERAQAFCEADWSADERARRSRAGLAARDRPHTSTR